MFGLFERSGLASADIAAMKMEAQVAIAVPKPKAPEPSLDVPTEEYVSLASSLGLTFGANELEAARFEGYLLERGLLIYSFLEVQRYLNQEYRGGAWGFRALRPQDNPGWKIGHFIASDGTINNGSRKWTSEHNGQFIGGQDMALYSKPVPYPVLLTIQSIESAFPNASFWVSDELGPQKHIVKDPFLAVRIGERRYIIERWDEPGFRLTAKEGV